MCLAGFNDREKPDDIFKEALQMHDLDHCNVMSLVGVYFIKSDPCIVMPYMENGSLLTHLKKERQNLIVTVKASEQVSFNVICSRVTCIMKGTKVQTLGARAVAGAWCMAGWLGHNYYGHVCNY